VDDMVYNEAGNEVRLTKYFPPRAHILDDKERNGG